MSERWEYNENMGELIHYMHGRRTGQRREPTDFEREMMDELTTLRSQLDELVAAAEGFLYAWEGKTTSGRKKTFKQKVQDPWTRRLNALRTTLARVKGE